MTTREEQDEAEKAKGHPGFDHFVEHAIANGIGDAANNETGHLGFPEDWLPAWHTFVAGWEAAKEPENIDISDRADAGNLRRRKNK